MDDASTLQGSERRLVETLFLVAAVAFAAYAAIFVYLAVRHILYPGFTEAVEGDVLQAIGRVLALRTPYPPPTSEYIPLSYPPLYYVLAAPFYRLFGDSFAGPRLLSSLCALVSGGAVCGLAWEESKSASTACVSGALFFAGYRIMDAVLTSAMGDSLMLACLMLALWGMYRATTRLQDALWVFLFALAFWAKQQGALFGGFALLYALAFRRNALPRWAMVSLYALCVPIAYLSAGAVFGDYFHFYTFTMPHRWGQELWIAVRRTSFFLGTAVPFALLLTLAYLRSARRLAGWRPSPAAFFVLAALISSASTMAVLGSSNNHYIPFFAALAVTAALGARAVLLSEEPLLPVWWVAAMTLVSIAVVVGAIRAGYGARAPMHAPWLLLATLVVCLVARRGRPTVLRRLCIVTALIGGQLGVSVYHLPDYLPARGSGEAVADLQATLSTLDAPVVWVTYGNAPQALTGIELARGPSWVALEDVERQQNAEVEVERMLSVFREGVRARAPLYLLSNDPIGETSQWRRAAPGLRLVRDFGPRFRAVQQITRHWFLIVGYPRFLYHVDAPAQGRGE